MSGRHDTQLRGSCTPVHITCDELPARNPTFRWIGGEWEGTLPIHTGEELFHPSVVDSGVGGIQHVFLCEEITCAKDLLDSVEGDGYRHGNSNGGSSCDSSNARANVTNILFYFFTMSVSIIEMHR